MSNNFRAFSSLLFALALYILLSELNGALARYAIHVNVDILFVIFAGFYLRILHGWWIVLIMGMFLDAGRLTPPGMSTLGLIFMWMVTVWLRHRFRRDRFADCASVAIGAQFIWLLILQIALAQDRAMNFHYWYRFLTDGAISLSICGALAWHWCQIQRIFILWTGWDLNAENNRV